MDKLKDINENVSTLRKELIKQIKTDCWTLHPHSDSSDIILENKYFCLKISKYQFYIKEDRVYGYGSNTIYFKEIDFHKWYFLYLKFFYLRNYIKSGKKIKRLRTISESSIEFFKKNKELNRDQKINDILQ